MIETNRLLLLPFTFELAEATIMSKENLTNVLNYNVSKEWPSPQYMKLIKIQKDKLQQNPEASAWGRIAIHKETQTLIGEIGCKALPDENGKVEIGYGMVSEARNKGLATEMVIGFTKWLISQPDVKNISAECLVSNIASAKVLKKSGFNIVKEGEDTIYWQKA
ncbi:GNAT family N-acetyltransferase [Fictibacillus nanhaiensis]|uniref:GNAT family N-acetyltransferase n=1 Tax=Fictibacillus nanhaiensis TaxID=742169 RepID=UPI002E1EC0E1|nr:GNAT family N-acetyltransferase [Fictibacillus nanhaiensis]